MDPVQRTTAISDAWLSYDVTSAHVQEWDLVEARYGHDPAWAAWIAEQCAFPTGHYLLVDDVARVRLRRARKTKEVTYTLPMAAILAAEEEGRLPQLYLGVVLEMHTAHAEARGLPAPPPPPSLDTPLPPGVEEEARSRTAPGEVDLDDPDLPRLGIGYVLHTDRLEDDDLTPAAWAGVIIASDEAWATWLEQHAPPLPPELVLAERPDGDPDVYYEATTEGAVTCSVSVDEYRRVLQDQQENPVEVMVIILAQLYQFWAQAADLPAPPSPPTPD